MIEGIAGAVALGVTGALGVATDRTANKRKKAFKERYGTFEGFRSQVDEERIQRVRREKGNVSAIKVVRENYPYVSLAFAKRYVEELPS
jgi:ribosomal protein L7/L12